MFSETLPSPLMLLESAPRSTVSKKRSVCHGENVLEPSNKLRMLSSQLLYEMKETDEYYNIYIDMPGVKFSDIEVDVIDDTKLRVQGKRKIDEETVKNYNQSFLFDRKKFDLSNVNATLENGLLTLKVTKKQPMKPLIIDVATESSLENGGNEDGNKIGKHDAELVTLDLPGVKINDLKVSFHEQAIHVDAKRQRGDSIVKIRKVIAIDDGNYDITSVRAHLIDGVLKVIAPVLESSDSNISSSGSNKKSVTISLPSPTLQHNTNSPVDNYDLNDTRKE
jgi:HSP20 family molecular chaperone IbpA